MKIWRMLTAHGKIIVFFSFLSIMSSPLLMPALKTGHYLITDGENISWRPHSFEQCSSKPGFTFDNNMFIVDKKNWFCGQSVPTRTKITFNNQVIFPEKEDMQKAVYTVDLAHLPKGWKLIALE